MQCTDAPKEINKQLKKKKNNEKKMNECLIDRPKERGGDTGDECIEKKKKKGSSKIRR